MIKRWIMITTLSALLCLTPYAAPDAVTGDHAAPSNERIAPSVLISLEDTADFKEIQALERDILRHAASMTRDLGYTPVSSDIDWSRAVKMYLQSPELFKENPDMDRFYEETDYIWVIPMDIKGATIEVTLNIGEPVSDQARALLSEEEVQKLEASVGKWKAVGGSRYTGYFDYKEDIAAALSANGFSEDCESFMLTALSGISMPLVVVVEDGRPAYIFPALNDDRAAFAEKTNARERGASVDALIYHFDDVIQEVEAYLEYLSTLEDGILSGGDIPKLDIEPVHFFQHDRTDR